MRHIAGFTALEWTILIVMAGLLFTVAGHMTGGGKPSGLVYTALGETGSLIEVNDEWGIRHAADPGALSSASSQPPPRGDTERQDLDGSGCVLY